ncbi:acyltransferase family protein [Pantoea agglomerans]|uniref:acyltransferase family protein n=1 Tax=Enterobacter agglomerans TaxID=549 RepID=UPI002412F493|nr:acyltransferase [Pantoea agglomerans]
MSGKEERLYYLDSIRGVAALMVASAHFIERTPLHGVLFFKFFNLGQIGVVAFFILSGMVIPYSLRAGKRPLLKFLVSRFFRLYPAYWFSVLLAVFTFTCLYGIKIPIVTILKNVTMFQSLMRAPDLFGVYWTLIIEILFYTLCACLFLINLLSKENVKFCISLCLLAISVMLSLARYFFERKLPVAIPLCMSLMFFGSIWRDVSLGVANRATKKSSVIFLSFFLVFLIPISFMAYNRDYGHGENAISYVVSYTAGIALTIFLTTKFKIYNKIIVYLGSISYSVYLVHPFFLEIFFVKTNMSRGFDFLMFFTYLFSVIVLASFSYYLIERSGVSLGRKINTLMSADEIRL